jgi:hypothetical protein
VPTSFWSDPDNNVVQTKRNREPHLDARSNSCVTPWPSDSCSLRFNVCVCIYLDVIVIVSMLRWLPRTHDTRGRRRSTEDHIEEDKIGGVGNRRRGTCSGPGLSRSLISATRAMRMLYHLAAANLFYTCVTGCHFRLNVNSLRRILSIVIVV